MKINEIKKLLKESPREIVFFLWGPPGIGKSSLVKQVAEEKGIGFIDLRLSLLDATDLRGLPMFKDGYVEWARPRFIPEEGEGILFLDEMNTALPAVQNGALQLVYDWRSGPHELGRGWRIVLAGNKKEHGTHVWTLSAALVNRVVHINVDVDVDNWLEYAFQRKLDERVIAFIKFRPELLYQPSKVPEAPFASPRAYEFLSRMLRVQEVSTELVQGIIGEGPGTEFVAYLRAMKDLPNIDDVLAGKQFEMPQEASTKIAFISGLVMRAEKNLHLVLRILNEIEPEVSVFGMKSLFHRGLKDNIVSTPEWKLWYNKNKEVIL